MATATEILAGIVNLRKTDQLNSEEGYISQIPSGATNPIYQIPAGKWAEVVVHVWAQGDSGGFNQLGRLCMGHLGGTASNRHLHTRYLQNYYEASYPLLSGGLTNNFNVGEGVQGLYFSNNVWRPRDNKFILDENMYIFRDSSNQRIGNTSLLWDITVFLRNKP